MHHVRDQDLKLILNIKNAIHSLPYRTHGRLRELYLTNCAISVFFSSEPQINRYQRRKSGKLKCIIFFIIFIPAIQNITNNSTITSIIQPTYNTTV